jgi:hypothetical protein
VSIRAAEAASKGFRKGCYGECLTRYGNYVAYYELDPMRNLAPSTEAQEVLRITDDRPSARIRYRQGVDNGLGKNPPLAGFFSPAEKLATDLVGASLLAKADCQPTCLLVVAA